MARDPRTDRIQAEQESLAAENRRLILELSAARKKVGELEEELRWERGAPSVGELAAAGPTAPSSWEAAQRYLERALNTAGTLASGTEDEVRAVLQAMYRIHEGHRSGSGARSILRWCWLTSPAIGTRWPGGSLSRNLNVLERGAEQFLRNTHDELPPRP